MKTVQEKVNNISDDIKNILENKINLDFFFSYKIIDIDNPFLITNLEKIIILVKEKIINNTNINILIEKNNKIQFLLSQTLSSVFDFFKVNSKIIYEYDLETFTINLTSNNNLENNFIQFLTDNTTDNVFVKDNTIYYNSKLYGLTLSVFQFCSAILLSFDETFGKDIVAYDLEASGLGKLDELTEIGAIKIRNGNIIDTFQTLINPKTSIPHAIVQLTGITNEMVKNAPDVKTATIKFYEFMKNIDTIVVHNGGFDISSIRNRFKKFLNKPFNMKVYDTRALSQSVKPGSGLDLSSLSAEFNVKLKNAHRALADATATGKVFLKLQLLRNSKYMYWIKNNIFKFSISAIIENIDNKSLRIIIRNSILSNSKFNFFKLLNKKYWQLPIPLNKYLILQKFLLNRNISELDDIIKNNNLNLLLNKLFVLENNFKFDDEIKNYNNDFIELKLKNINKQLVFILTDFWPYLNNNISNWIKIKDIEELILNKNKLILKNNKKNLKVQLENTNLNLDKDKMIYNFNYTKYGFLNFLNKIVCFSKKEN